MQIVDALKRCAGKVRPAARALGCYPNSIYVRARKNKLIARHIDDGAGGILVGVVKPLYCVHCGDRASMPGDDGPECTDCAIELATGRLPHLANITSR